MDRLCPSCNAPVPLNELIAYGKHENCWIERQLRVGVITVGDSRRRIVINRNRIDTLLLTDSRKPPAEGLCFDSY